MLLLATDATQVPAAMAVCTAVVLPQVVVMKFASVPAVQAPTVGPVVVAAGQVMTLAPVVLLAAQLAAWVLTLAPNAQLVVM